MDTLQHCHVILVLAFLHMALILHCKKYIDNTQTQRASDPEGHMIFPPAVHTRPGWEHVSLFATDTFLFTSLSCSDWTQNNQHYFFSGRWKKKFTSTLLFTSTEEAMPLSICVLVCWKDYTKTKGQIITKLKGEMWYEFNNLLTLDKCKLNW